jgi:hypothetical protein
MKFYLKEHPKIYTHDTPTYIQFESPVLFFFFGLS